MHLVCAVATSYSAAQPMEFHRVRWLCSRLWPLNTMHNRCTDYVCVCVVYEYIIHTIPEQACAVCSAYTEEKKNPPLNIQRTAKLISLVGCQTSAAAQPSGNIYQKNFIICLPSSCGRRSFSHCVHHRPGNKCKLKCDKFNQKNAR